MTTTTIEFNGIEFHVRFDADVRRGHHAVISYPSFEESGFDPSTSEIDDYPTAEIEAFVSRSVGRPVKFAECTSAGCDVSAWESWRFREVEESAVVALHNDPERTALVSEMTDEEIALCIRNAAALDADILAAEDGGHDTDREYVAAYAAAHLARYGEVWTLP